MTFDRPVIIVGSPRSGTTLLYTLLSELPDLWSIGGESKHIIEASDPPAAKGWDSGVLTAADASADTVRFIHRAFWRQAAPGSYWRRVNRLRGWLRGQGVWQALKARSHTERAGAGASAAVPQQGLAMVQRLARLRNRLDVRHPPSIRLLEKTPENCLRLPFLLQVFPGATVIFLVRDGRSNVSSLLDGWRHPTLFPGYQVPEKLRIPDYHRPRWAFTLIPGWRELTAATLPEICARQWMGCNEAVLGFHQAHPEVPFMTVRHESLVADGPTVLADLAAFAGVNPDRDWLERARSLPQINAVTAPSTQKWRQHNREEVQQVLPLISPMMQRLGYDPTNES